MVGLPKTTQSNEYQIVCLIYFSKLCINYIKYK